MQEVRLSENEKQVYTAKEAAKAYDVSLPVFYALCKRDDFPAVRIGRKIIVPKAALEAWFLEHAGNGQIVEI